MNIFWPCALWVSVLACDPLRVHPCSQVVSALSDWTKLKPQCAAQDMVQLIVSGSFTSVPAGYFSNFSKLDTLCIRNNSALRTLPSGFLSGLSSLTDLRLKNNILASLPSGFLSNLTSLQAIDLSDNRLVNVSSSLFRNNPYLQSIKLDGNVLKSLPAGLLNGLSRLQKLDIRQNRLSALPVGFFNSLLTLTDLSMDCPPECTLKCLQDAERMPTDCVAVSRQLPLRFYHASGTVSPSRTPSHMVPYSGPDKTKAPTRTPTRTLATVSPATEPSSGKGKGQPPPAQSPSRRPRDRGEVTLPPNASSVLVSLQGTSVGLPGSLFTIFNDTKLTVVQNSTAAFPRSQNGQEVGDLVVSISITDRETGAAVSALPAPINFTLPRSGNECSPTCGWYHFGSATWQTGGCTAQILNASTLLCTCTHLTDFAMLYQGIVCDPAPRPWLFVLVALYALILLYSTGVLIRQAWLRLFCAMVSVQHFLVCGVAIFRILAVLRYLAVFSVGDVGKASFTAAPYIFQDLVLSILIESWRQAVASTTGHIRVRPPLIIFNLVFFILVVLLAVGLANWGSASAWALAGTLVLGLLLVVFMVAFGVGGVLMKRHLAKSGIKGNITQVSSLKLGIRFQRVGAALSFLFAVEVVSSVCALAWVGDQSVLLALTTVYLAADVCVWGVVLLGYWDAVWRQRRAQSRSDKSREANLANKREREYQLAQRRRHTTPVTANAEDRQSLMSPSQPSASVTITTEMSPVRMIVDSQKRDSGVASPVTIHSLSSSGPTESFQGAPPTTVGSPKPPSTPKQKLNFSSEERPRPIAEPRRPPPKGPPRAPSLEPMVTSQAAEELKH